MIIKNSIIDTNTREVNKMTNWEYNAKEIKNTNWTYRYYICSRCGAEVRDTDFPDRIYAKMWCPYCGLKKKNNA